MNGTHSMSQRVVSWQADSIVLPVVLLIVLAARPGDSQLASRAEDPAGPVEPIDIGSRLELMVDDYLIERMSGGAELRLHRPAEREVVFTCDKPWEGNHSGSVTVFQDGDTYRMYYRAAD